MKNTPKKSAVIPTATKAQLARRLGISRQLLAWHLRSPDAPKDLRDIEAWRNYLADVAREAGLPVKLREQIAAERIRLLKAQAEKAERDNAEAAGTLMPVQEAQRQAREAMAMTFSELDRMCRELAAGIGRPGHR